MQRRGASIYIQEEEPTIEETLGTLWYKESTYEIRQLLGDPPIWTLPASGPGGATNWGSIGGTLSAQIDLGLVIDSKIDGGDIRLTDSRNPLAHSHAPSDVTGTAVITNDARLSDSRAPTAHTHVKTEITDLGTIGTAAAKNIPASGDAAATEVVYGTDTRLSDARTPVAHNQAESTLTFTDITTNNADSTKHGFLPKWPNNTTTFLRGDGTYAALAANGQPLGLTVLANDTLAQALATNINTKLTVTAARTLTTTVPAAGVRCSVLILTSGTSSFVVTFGSGFKPVSTLATGTTSGRIFVVSFISDGTNLYEFARTAAMVA